MISILVTNIDSLTVWMRQSLAVAAMAKLGVVHPPAGASAMIFASESRLGWTNLVSLLLGNVVSGSHIGEVGIAVSDDHILFTAGHFVRNNH
jgi:CBS-domain-containing membrane protein